jgi:hypothetical protein
VGGGERVHPLDHALEPLPPLALLPGVSFPNGTREDHPHNRRSEDSLEPEEPPKPPSALLLVFWSLLSLSARVDRGKGSAFA